MNAFGKNSVIAVGLIATLLMSGCASVAGGTQSIGNTVGVKDRTMASAVGGGILGCIGGGLVGLAKGGLVGLGIGCGGGIAVGAAVSVLASEKVQIDEMRKGQAAMQTDLNKVQSGLQIVVQTKKVTETKQSLVGTTSKEEDKFARLIMPLPMQAVHEHSPAIAAIVAKAGVLAAQSKGPTPVQIDVYSAARDHAWFSSILDVAIPDNSPVRYKWHEAKTPSLVLSPIPQVAPTTDAQR